MQPYSRQLKILESLRLNRILSGLTYVAKQELTYHLWWHPHNLGIHQKENVLFLEKLLKHYCKLKNDYAMKNLSMEELSGQLSAEGI